MKLFLSFLLSAFCLAASAQIGGIIQNPGKPTQSSHGMFQYDWLQAAKQLQIPHDTINVVDSVNNIALLDSTLWGRILIAPGVKRWVRIIGGGSTDSAFVADSTITSLPSVGLNPGANLTPQQWITNVFYRPKPPLATLTASTTAEVLPPGSPVDYTLNWTASRQSNTKPLSSVVVAGYVESFTQPAAGAGISGTQAVQIARNQNTTFSIVVITSDGQMATASVFYNWLPRRYYGFTASATPSDADIRALGSELSASNAKSYVESTYPDPAGQHYVYAYPASEGDLVTFDINGIPAIASLTLTKRIVTTTTGSQQLYNVYVSNQLFTAQRSTTIVTK